MNLVRAFGACMCLTMAVAGAFGAVARADPVADFYRDRTLTVVSAGDAGGAHGVYGQLIAGLIGKYIPGNPRVNVQYMVGAGGNQSMNYLFNVAPKDGSYVGVPLQDLIFNARLGVAAVKYDPRKVHYLGGADVTRTTLTVMKVSGVASIEDARRREVVIGASGASGQNYVVPVVLNALLGTRFKVVTGYPGIDLIHLAMDRGEIQGTAASWAVIAGTRKEWIEHDRINNLITIGMDRDPNIAATPALAELLTKQTDIDLVPLLAGSAALGRAWVTFGDVPPDRLAALRAAYARVMADPDFRVEAKKRGLPLEPVDSSTQDGLAASVLATPDSAVSRLKAILGLE